jgi:hypothetical protein
LRDAGPTDDATDGSIIDTPPDAFDPLCFGGAPFTICMPSMPAGDKSLDSVDTDGPSSCDSGEGTTMMVGANPVAACVIAADTISLGSTLVGVSGDKPLVLLAVTRLRINAGSTLDITSGRTAGDGPGANPTDCGPAPTGSDNLGGGGGGAGGSFGASGGAGAPGGGGPGGTPRPPAAVPVDKLRGGCPGGTGGDGDGDGDGARAPGSSGGGAVYLLTRGELIVDGTVDASGAGGNGGNSSKGGGGGGGSGGMILIHAGSLRVGPQGKLIANGGGGGGGAGNGTDGADGSDPSTIDMAAPGGPPNGGGSSAGGAGGFKSTAAGSATNTGNGGAAGGGSVGVIRVLSGQPIPANNVSPTPQLN